MSIEYHCPMCEVGESAGNLKAKILCWNGCGRTMKLGRVRASFDHAKNEAFMSERQGAIGEASLAS